MADDLYIPKKFDKQFSDDHMRQNWLEIERWAARVNAVIPSGSPTLFDAVINSALATNSPSTHTYVNIAGVIANEPNWTSAKDFAIAVIQNSAASIDLTSNTFPGPATFVGVGDQSSDHTGAWASGINLSALDIRGTINAPFFRITFKNIMIFNGGVSSFNLFGSTTKSLFLDSEVSGEANGATNLNMGSGSGDMWAENTRFYGINPFIGTGQLYFNDCSFAWGRLTAVSISASLWWFGGQIGVTTGGVSTARTLTFAGSSNILIDGAVNPVPGVPGVEAANLSLSSTGFAYVIASGCFRDVTVVAGVGHTYIDVDRITSLTVNGNTTPPSVRRIKATIVQTANPAITLAGCTDSIIEAWVTGPGGSQAYTLDGTSKRNTIILGGNQAANYTVPSTDTGLDNAVHDNQGIHAHGRTGVATLVGGTVVVANTLVTANSRIMLTVQALGTVAVPKAVAATARVVGTSFTITSADATDTSVVAWELLEP